MIPRRYEGSKIAIKSLVTTLELITIGYNNCNGTTGDDTADTINSY